MIHSLEDKSHINKQTNKLYLLINLEHVLGNVSSGWKPYQVLGKVQRTWQASKC